MDEFLPLIKICYLKILGTLDVPDGYPSNPVAFVNKCLLTNVLVGYYFNQMVLEGSKIFEYLSPLFNLEANNKSKNTAGNLLSQILNELCLSNPNISSCGPHNFNEVGPILAEKLKTQIHVIEGVQEKHAVISSFPAEYNDKLPQIFLAKTFENHVMLINNLKSFGFSQKKTFCLECKQTFYYNYRHRCSKRPVCFPCKRFFSSQETVILKYQNLEFCNSKLEEFHLPVPLNCDKCNLNFLTKDCFDSHLKLCGYKGFGRRGFKCQKCNKFTVGRSKFFKQLESEHVCTDKIFRCANCFKIHDKTKQCKIKFQAGCKQFPNLVFYSFQYQNIENCSNCHSIRCKFKSENKLNWQQVYNHLEFPNLSCPEHIEISSKESQPNCAVIFKEVDRGKFSRIIIADDNLEEETLLSPNSLEFKYMSDEMLKRYPMQTRSDYQKCVTLIKNKREIIKTQTSKSMMDKFFLLITSENWQNSTFIAFNSNAREHVTILKKFVNLGIQPHVLMNGNKIDMLHFKSLNIKFLDLSNFLSGTLEDLRKNFCPSEKIIYFPEKLNLPTYYSYSGNIPSFNSFVKFSDSKQDTDLILKFYNENYFQSWNFKEALYFSLEQKTSIVFKSALQLLKDALNFQVKIKSSKNLNDPNFIHPFENSISISSFSFQTFKFYFMNHFDIRTVKYEYSGCQKNSSFRELQYVSFMDFNYPQRKFIHNFNNPEGQKVFGRYPVDLYSPVDKTVIQFFGCQVHCHNSPNCHINAKVLEKENPKNCYNKSFKDVNLRDAKEKDYLLSEHSDEVQNYHVQWECEFITEQKNDFSYLIFESICGVVNRPTHRLVPRATVRGGLLEVYNLKWTQDLFPDEIFQYSDVNSLYSHVAIKYEFPVGECNVYVCVHDEISENITFVDGQHCFKNVPIICGAAHVRVLAPSNLKMPFLQYRIKNQFNYLALCKRCAEKKLKNCRHSEHHRSFESCWLISDLDKAVSLGYIILNWYELHHYPQRTYLLRDYSKMLFSEKLKNTGWPDNVTSDLQKLCYCNMINEALDLPEEFQLSLSNVKFNESKKQLAKSQMNNFFGKFAQNSNLKKSEFVNSISVFENLLANYNITNLFQINENILKVEYENFTIKPNLSTNIYIGAQITSYARIEMYNFMTEIEKSLGKIYSVDTDGLFYSLPKNVLDPLPFSNLCGHFKSMLKPNQVVRSYVSLGPRNYSLLLSDGHEIENVIKVRGLSLSSHHLSEQLSVEVYSDFLEAQMKNITKKIIIPQEKFLINYEKGLHFKRHQNYSFHNDLFIKRFVKKVSGPSIETNPYGFKK